MSHLDAILAASTHRAGRARRTALVRHRRLVPAPMAVALWQLGGEPFSAAAVAWGTTPGGMELAVAGEPRNRDLAFAALLRFARWFIPAFEAHAHAPRERVPRGEHVVERAGSAPQVIVANAASVEMLARLGRRLAYLRTDGPYPAPPELVRLGQHLQFLAKHVRVPGQQLVVAMTELLGSHWATAQSPLERMSLSAIDAFVDPPAGVHGFAAAVRAERDLPVGPSPVGTDDGALWDLVEGFNALRGERTAHAAIAPLLEPIVAHYRPRLARTYELLWRCRDREAAFPEAPSVARRWDDDRDAYTRHIDWVSQGGRRRTRETPRQAAMQLRGFEDAQARLDAEEACEDRLRMIPYLLDQKAVEGRVVAIDRSHQEIAKVRAARRPLVTIATDTACVMPPGKELWWSSNPSGAEWVVEAVRDATGGGSLVTLKLTTGSKDAALPAVGSTAVFSIHTTSSRWRTPLADQAPWTHRSACPVDEPEAIEREALIP